MSLSTFLLIIWSSIQSYFRFDFIQAPFPIFVTFANPLCVLCPFLQIVCIVTTRLSVPPSCFICIVTYSIVGSYKILGVFFITVSKSFKFVGVCSTYISFDTYPYGILLRIFSFYFSFRIFVISFFLDMVVSFWSLSTKKFSLLPPVCMFIPYHKTFTTKNSDVFDYLYFFIGILIESVL